MSVGLGPAGSSTEAHLKSCVVNSHNARRTKPGRLGHASISVFAVSACVHVDNCNESGFDGFALTRFVE